MSFSNEWEERYRENTHLSVWPWSDLVSFVMRHARPDRKNFRVLELGCGAGANIPFFEWLGVDYHAIEGSRSIVERLKTTHPELEERIVAGDFTRGIPFPGRFDLVVDRAALTHNDTASIEMALEVVRNKLSSGGKYVGIDWFSTDYCEFEKGTTGGDENTRTGYREGSFSGVGKVHFSDREHLLHLFRNFEIMALEHKIIRREIPQDGWHFASWNLVARKI